MNLQEISVIRKYATAYMLSKGEDAEKKIENLKKVIDLAKSYSNVLKNPIINYEIKNEILRRIIPHELIKTLAFNVILILVKHKRFGFIDQIYEKSYEIFLKSRKRRKVIVYSRNQLSENARKMILDFFKDAGLGEPVIEWRQNLSCVGGFIIRWDDIIIDSTLNSKIDRLVKTVKEGVIL